MKLIVYAETLKWEQDMKYLPGLGKAVHRAESEVSTLSECDALFNAVRNQHPEHIIRAISEGKPIKGFAFWLTCANSLGKGGAKP